MICITARVSSARVETGGRSAAIGPGFLCLLGVHEDDTEADSLYIADRLWGLRVFRDETGKMNLTADKANRRELLLVSQFTLIADLSQRRPSFARAAPPEKAERLYEEVRRLCAEKGFTVRTGVFGAEMQVFSQNDGPVTVVLDSQQKNRFAGVRKER